MSTETPDRRKNRETFNVKLVLLGEAAVGKSSLVLRVTKDKFEENKEPTIGAAFLTLSVELEGDYDIKFEIWDTAGQERFASLAPMYYRNAQAALVVYDLTKPSSLTKAKHWVAELQRQASPGMTMALVGNKLDLCKAGSTEPEQGGNAGSEEEQIETNEAEPAETDARKISTREAKAYAEEEGTLFFEASAKEGTNVQEIFKSIAMTIPQSSLKSKKAGNRDNTSGGAAGRSEQSGINLTEQTKQQQDTCAC